MWQGDRVIMCLWQKSTGAGGGGGKMAEGLEDWTRRDGQTNASSGTVDGRTGPA